MEMTTMDVSKEVERVIAELNEVKQDVDILTERINNALIVIKNVKTEKDAKEFDEQFADMENGLKHICLF